MSTKKDLLEEIEYWSTVYDLNFQFWHDNNSVYITKDDVPYKDFGGYGTIEEVFLETCVYLRGTNPRMYREYIGLSTIGLPPLGSEDYKKHKLMKDLIDGGILDVFTEKEKQ